jgi:hypothetical protein
VGWAGWAGGNVGGEGAKAVPTARSLTEVNFLRGEKRPMTSDPSIATHDAACQMVKDVFVSMGGRIVEPEPEPERPQTSSRVPKPRRRRQTRENDAFLMDFENAILREQWDARKGIPKGPCRWRNAEWAALIKKNVFPFHSGVTWEEYVQWARAGGGDEWFQREKCIGPLYDGVAVMGPSAVYING